METPFNFSGILTIKVFHPDGTIKSETIVPNLVVLTGRTFIASRMANASSTVMSHMAIGSGTTAASASDSALQTEVARVALNVAGGTPSSNNITYSASFGAGVGIATIAEAGIFNAASSGTLLARSVFTGIVKGSGDSMDISWTISAN